MFRIKWNDFVSGLYDEGVYDKKFNSEEEAIQFLVEDILENYGAQVCYCEKDCEGYIPEKEFINTIRNSLLEDGEFDLKILDNSYYWCIEED